MRIDKVVGKISLLISDSWIKDIVRDYYHFKILKKMVYVAYTKNYLIIVNKTGRKIKIPNSKLDLSRRVIEISALEGYLTNYIPKCGDVVIDAGAYVGVITLIMSKLVGERGKVISFEPDPLNYENLLENIKKHSLKNIIPINKGLMNKSGKMDFYSNRGVSSSYIKPDNYNNPIKIKTTTLDYELKKLRIHKINFLKVDVEGAEIDLLKGAEKTLKNNNVNISVASYHVVNGEKTCFKVRDLLNSFGYKTKIGNPKHLTTYGRKN